MPRIAPGDAPAEREPLATADDIAAYLSVPKQTIYQWSSRGGGPKMIKVGRHIRARWEDLDDYLDAQTIGAA